MKNVVITADSTVDLSPELIERYDIRIIPLTIEIGDESYKDGQDFTPSDMYARYHADGTLPKTAAPNVRDFTHFFHAILEEGSEIVHLDISSDLSNTYNAACLAAQELEGVWVVDSRELSTGIGLLAIEGAECRDRGMSAQEIADHLAALTGKVSASFVIENLEFIWKGGRCSSVTALGANIMKIRPALEMRDGTLTIYKKFRGKMENVYRQYIEERLKDKKIRTGHVFLTESGEIPEAVVEYLTAYIKELTHAEEVHHTTAGCTVSSHCGPRTLGVLFIEE